MRRSFTSDWVSYRAETWLRWLQPWIGRDNVAALEIGSHEGRSACWFCDHVLTAPSSYLVMVDLWADKAAEILAAANTEGLRVFRRKGHSSAVLARLTTEGRRYAFAYIDGEHSAAQTLADLCAVWPLIMPGGVVIVDDYHYTAPHRPIPPQPAIDAFLACYADRIARHEVSEIASWQVAIWKPEPTE